MHPVKEYNNKIDVGTGVFGAIPNALEPLLTSPWPSKSLPHELRDLPEEAGEKFGVPPELTGSLMIVLTAAHAGSSIRLGAPRDFGLPVNLKVALCSGGERSLNLLFQTLGKRLFETEETTLPVNLRRKGKPLPSVERETLEYEYNQQKEKTPEMLNDFVDRFHRLNRIEKPHVLYDEGSPAFLSRMIENSVDSGILALSDRGLPIVDYLHEFSADQKTEFLRLMRRASDMAPIKSEGDRNAPWHFAGRSLINVFWNLDFPTLSAALRDERMKMAGFWNDFVLIDSRKCPELETFRMGALLKSLPAWERSMKEVFFKRKTNDHMLMASMPETDQVFEEFRKELLVLLPRLEQTSKPFVGKWMILAQKIAANLQLLAYGGGTQLYPEQADAGVVLTKWLGARTLQMQRYAALSQFQNESLKAEEIMLAKLGDKGAVDFRTLCRSYRKQGKDRHSPVLESLLNKGLVEIGEDDLIRLAA